MNEYLARLFLRGCLLQIALLYYSHRLMHDAVSTYHPVKSAGQQRRWALATRQISWLLVVANVVLSTLAPLASYTADAVGPAGQVWVCNP